MEILRDKHNRIIDYLRISVTDRCNLRCRYCAPHGIVKVPREEILSCEEIVEIVKASAALGVSRIKITGGEPLVRGDIVNVVRQIKAVEGIKQVTMTTNGVKLNEYLPKLLSAGLCGVNISLDTLDSQRFLDITGTDALQDVINAVKTSLNAGIKVKINTVVMEDTDWKSIIHIAKEMPVDVRFIEMMPIGFGRDFVCKRDVLSEIRQEYPELTKDSSIHGNGPAAYYRLPGFCGSIGFISSMHDKFCSSCNRIRLSSMGYLKTCLCYEDGVDLRAIVRSGKSEEERAEALKRAIVGAVINKPKAHCFTEPQNITEEAVMSSIGG